jgi:hypothetical protein
VHRAKCSHCTQRFQRGEKAFRMGEEMFHVACLPPDRRRYDSAFASSRPTIAPTDRAVSSAYETRWRLASAGVAVIDSVSARGSETGTLDELESIKQRICFFIAVR